MKFLSKFPFETIVLMVFLYFVGIVLIIENNTFANKFTFLFVAVGILMMGVVFSLAFRKELDRFNSRFFDDFGSGKFDKRFLLGKILTVTRLGLLPFFLTTIAEFILTFLFTEAGAVTIGYPLPVYSFSAELILPLNFIIDIITFSLLVLFAGKLYQNEQKLITS